MAKRRRETELHELEEIVGKHMEGLTATEIRHLLMAAPPQRTLQHRLKALVEQKRLVRQGKGRGARYHVPRIVAANLVSSGTSIFAAEGRAVLPLSKEGKKIQSAVQKPPAARRPVGYERNFLDSYRPNETFYLSVAERAHLGKAGVPKTGEQPAGTYAKQILDRLLIDLSWNSSRLEGNTYSLLDTKRLLDLGEEAEGKGRREAQMILNHKDAVAFLVREAEEIGFNRYTILNLHALLANNLLGNPEAQGRLRHIGVGIEGSVFHPLAAPQVIEECFDQILASATAIADPFEQAFFMMVQMPYLQPFDDANKRVSRLAANIPLIKRNLSPLSFVDVPRQAYTEAILAVYELRRPELLRDVFIWAYERSALRYAAVRQSLGEPDPFRMKHRAALRDVVQSVVRSAMNKMQAASHVHHWSKEHVEEGDAEKFQELAESELLGLHEGNFARYQIKPSEFAAWRLVW